LDSELDTGKTSRIGILHKARRDSKALTTFEDRRVQYEAVAKSGAVQTLFQFAGLSSTGDQISQTTATMFQFNFDSEKMKVFASSTFRDLAEHREVLRLALESSGYEFRGMEHFAADERAPLEVALRAMDGCDVYLLIIGDLYGSTPPGRVISYTELENR
jgi:hypothetical protein